jgi:hypothetical protein
MSVPEGSSQILFNFVSEAGEEVTREPNTDGLVCLDLTLTDMLALPLTGAAPGARSSRVPLAKRFCI